MRPDLVRVGELGQYPAIAVRVLQRDRASRWAGLRRPSSRHASRRTRWWARDIADRPHS